MGNMGAQLKPEVAVIGGGCAGLAAAANLAKHGIAVTLFESAPHLGGRARGLQWKNTSLDNGQHILLGAYTETLKLLNLVGVNENGALMRMPLALDMHHALKIQANNTLPAPLNILWGFALAKGLTFTERASLLNIMIKLRLSRFKCNAELSVLNLLTQHQQSYKLIQSLWEPLCLAALNTPIERASAQIFLNVLKDSFAGNKTHSDLLLPKLDLSALIATPVSQYIQQKGGTIKRSTPVLSLEDTGEGIYVVTEASKLLFSHVVLAVAPASLPDICAQLPVMQTSVKQVQAFEYQPITTIYLQYNPSARLPNPMLGLVNTLSQWLFDRGQLYGQAGLIAVVISAQGKHQQLTQTALAEAVKAELSQRFSALGECLWHKVITEKRATFSCDVGLSRPNYNTNIKNLYLAGDYTYQDYPATIEGAVRSGVKCAAEIIKLTR